MVVTPTEADTGVLGLTIIDLTAYLYADDGRLASTHPERLHKEFDILTGLFNWVCLRKNTAKTVGIIYQPCHAPGGMSEEAY